MHNDSVDFVVKSIQKSPLVNLNGLVYQEYQDFFDDYWLEKLNFDSTKHKLVALEKQESLEKRFRRRVDYSETISKELNIFFKNKKITQSLQEIFGTKLTPDTSDIWIDYPGYYLMPHLDDTRIKLSLQIYTGNGKQPGTGFYTSAKLSTKVHEIRYKSNKGYALMNTDRSWHAVQPEIANGQRRSVFIRYK